MNTFIEQWLAAISTAIALNIWLAPGLVLLAGLLTSFTPCSLSSVPLIIGYVGGRGETDGNRAFRLSAVFASGTAVTFTILGAAASLLGKLIQGTGSWWYVILGILMVMMALQTWDIFTFIPSSNAMSKKRGYIGAFLAGILGGLFSSPCATPVLVVLLAIVAKEGNLLWGLVLLLLYSVGHSFLILIAGTSVGIAQKISSSETYGAASKTLKVLMGLIILMIGFYMFYLGF